MSELTQHLRDSQIFLREMGARVDGMLKLKEGALPLTAAQIAKMKDESACPTCGKRLTSMEVTHLAGGSTPASESARQTATPEAMRLRESAIQSYMGLGLPRAGAEAAADRGGEAA